MMDVSRRRFHALTASVLAAGALPSCLPEGQLKQRLNMTPRQLGDGWQTARPEQVGLDSRAVRAAYERVFSPDEYINALSLLVVRRGKLVAEGYVQRDSDIARKEHIQSVTKSLTSLAFGWLRDQGHFPELDASIAEFLPVHDAAKQAITLRHLLTMRSGIDVDNEAFAIDLLMPERRHMTEYLLDQPLMHEPGGTFDYRDCDPQLVGSVVLAATGRSIEAIMREQIFAELGISDVHWQHNADGEPLTAHGVWLRARDLAKIGELIRGGGSFAGRRLVSSEWLDAATAAQSDTGGGDLSEFAYGYYFWIVPELGAYSTWGHGGNFVFVVPDEELTLVLTSMPDSGDAIASELGDAVALAEQILGRR